MNINRKQYIIRSCASVAVSSVGAAAIVLAGLHLVGMSLVVAGLLAFYWSSIQRSLDIQYRHGYTALALVVASIALPMQVVFWVFLMFAPTSENNIKNSMGVARAARS